MSPTENKQLDTLLEIAQEDDTPLRDKDIEFIESLDAKRRELPLSDKQATWFDDLVEKHIRGER